MAIIMALQSAAYSSHQEICIFSDSQSVLKALISSHKIKNKSHLIWEILKLIFELKQAGKIVNLYWIPAHIGLEDDELADIAAKEAKNR